MITAAPPRTGCGMMEITAPIFGKSPASTRMIAPMEIAKRLTIFVMPTRPTFWLKEVLGSTPNTVASAEPTPSQITAPASSLSVASRFRPPLTTPAVSPTVSTAVTMNMMHMGTIAATLNCSFTGRSCGTANHAASFTSAHLVM